MLAGRFKNQYPGCAEQLKILCNAGLTNTDIERVLEWLYGRIWNMVHEPA